MHDSNIFQNLPNYSEIYCVEKSEKESYTNGAFIPEITIEIPVKEKNSCPSGAYEDCPDISERIDTKSKNCDINRCNTYDVQHDKLLTTGKTDTHETDTCQTDENKTFSRDVQKITLQYENEEFHFSNNCNNSDVEQNEVKTNISIGRWKWVVCFTTFMQCAMFEGVFFSFGLIFIELSNTFHTSKMDTAWIVSLNTGFCLLVGPFASVLFRWLGYWKVALVGTMVTCGGMVASMLAENVHTLYFTYGILAGSGNGIMYHLAVVCVIICFDKRKSLALGIALCGVGMGIFCISPIVEVCIQAYGWRGTILIEAGLLLNGITCGLVYRPLQTPKKKKPKKTKIAAIADKGPTLQTRERFRYLDTNVHQSEDKDKAIVPTDKQDTYFPNMSLQNRFKRIKHYVECIMFKNCSLSLLKRPAFTLYTVSTFLCFFAVHMPIAFIPDLAKTKGISEQYGAWLLSTVGFVGTGSRLVFGFLADRSWVNRFVLQGTSLILTGLFTALMPYCSSFWLLLIDIIMFSIFHGYITALVSILTAEIVGIDKLSQGYGLVCWFSGFANLLGAPTAGWLYDIFGNYEVSFGTFGVVFVLSGAILYVTSCVHRRGQPKG